MRQRQPDGPDLVVSRRLRIDDAARDIQMRLGIAVVEDPAVRGRNPNRNRAEEEKGRERDTQNAVQVLNSW